MMKKTIPMVVIAVLLLAMPIALAQENATNQTTEIKGGKEYPLLERALDRIRLAFTFQEQRKLELINRIEQRREEHYQFLQAQGKTDQAAKFKETTIGLVKNFDQWKANKQEILGRFANKTEEIRSKMNETEGKQTQNRTMPEKAMPKGRGY